MIRLRCENVSVPSFGDSFFIATPEEAVETANSVRFHPLIRGFFFYPRWTRTTFTTGSSRFRPLIRGFFFYPFGNNKHLLCLHLQFPSPHSGILFLLSLVLWLWFHCYPRVSVPSFGDSFFMRLTLVIHCRTMVSFRPLIRGFFFL